MSSFYGNIKNGTRVSLSFDKIYKNRVEMENSATSDGIYNGRYVLINYGEKYYDYAPITLDSNTYQANTYYFLNDQKEMVLSSGSFDKNQTYYLKLATDNILNKTEFLINRNKDEQKYHHTYNHTVWQKIWEQTGSTNTVVEKYIMVAELDAKAPHMSIIIDPPVRNTSEINYYKISSDLLQEDDTPVEDGKISKDRFETLFDLGIYTTEDETNYSLVESINDYSKSNTYYLKSEYQPGPHFDTIYSTQEDYKLHIPQAWKFDNETTFTYNEEGFDKQFRLQPSEDEKNEIRLIEQTSDEGKYFDHLKEWPTASHYTYDENQQLIPTKQKIDTKHFVIELSDIGKTMSEIWDLIYPLYKDEDEKSRLGKTDFEDNERHVFLGNDRDPDSVEYPQTLAETIRLAFKLLGLKEDNEAYDPIDPDTIYGLLNGASSIYGSPDDEVTGNMTLVPTDLENKDDGYISEDLFDTLKSRPLYYKDENGKWVKVKPDDTYNPNIQYYMMLPPGYQLIPTDISGSEDGYITQNRYDTINANPDSKYYPIMVYDSTTGTFTEAEGYTPDKQYYSRLVTLNAYLNDLKERFSLYQSDWANDNEDSIGYISNKPKIITIDQGEVPFDEYSINYLWYYYNK